MTSSGTTDDFETYNYDYFTNLVSIAGVFTSPGGSISISEVGTRASSDFIYALGKPTTNIC